MSLGIGAMIHYLGGGSENDVKLFIGKKVVEAKFSSENDKFYIGFDDGVKISIWDDGQSCCEHRYMTCDDNPKDIVGGELVSVGVKHAPDQEDDWEVHEIAFLEVVTTKGTVQFATHNEHNGYYGGFGLTITMENDF